MSAPAKKIARTERPIDATAKRTALFLSHANPEDNAFTIWLGAKLSALGYEVWADVMRLRAGDDWQRKLERALRNNARKVLFVGTPTAVEKQGPRNELEIANKTAAKIGDNEFIIPLQLKAFDAPFRIAHAQYINFEHRGWSAGLAELLTTLEEMGIPRTPGPVADTTWQTLQQMHGNTIVPGSESLISNWLGVAKMPAAVQYFEFRGTAPSNVASLLETCPVPVVPHRYGFLGLCELADVQPHFAATPLISAAFDLELFLEDGWPNQRIERREARNYVTTLIHRAIDLHMIARNLERFEMGDRQTTWWPPIDRAPTTKVAFRWGPVAGQRQLQGSSSVRRMHWHYGATFAYHGDPVRHVAVTSRLVFTDDGRAVVGDAARAHRLRRSFAKGWRNARWRDLLLAFLFWLGEGKDEIVFRFGQKQSMTLTLPPLQFVSPVTVPEPEIADFNDDEALDEAVTDDFDDDDGGDYE